MRRNLVLSCLIAGLLGLVSATGALALERRIALVIGEAAYPAKPLATAANDAGLIAQTLQAAGFDVTGARDLEGEALRRAFLDFLDKAGASGPETVAFVYFSGYGMQLEGENFLIPTDAVISRDTDIPVRAARLSDYLKPLAGLNLKTTIVVVDAARENPFALGGQPIAGGLALVEPPANLLLAYNAAPGTVAPVEPGPYGAYAHGLAEMIRAGGMPPMQVFEETRLRVSEVTKGAQIPWNSKVDSAFLFLQRTAEAPAREDDSALRAKPIAQLGAADAYTSAIQRDTLQGYQDYLAVYPGEPSAKRVRAILAARREALYWRRARAMDTPGAYWSYLRRYPHGPHAWDVRRRLEDRAIAMEPPQGFEPVDMGYPPPPPEEIVYVDRPYLYFDDPAFGFAPPPPPPLYFLPPPPPDFVVLAPPFIVGAAYILPMPAFVPVPAYVVAPAYIAPPPNNIYFENLHNNVVVDHGAQSLVIKNPEGHVLSSGALTAIGAGAAGAAIGASLPHFLAKSPVAAPGRPTGLAPVNHALPTNLPPPPSPGAAGQHILAPAGHAPNTPQTTTSAGVVGPHGAAPAGQKTQPTGLGAASPGQPSGLQGKTVGHPPAVSHASPPAAVHAASPPTPHAPPPVAHVAPPAMRATSPTPHVQAPPVMHVQAPAAPAFRAPAAPVARAPAAHAPHCSIQNGKPVCK